MAAMSSTNVTVLRSVEDFPAPTVSWRLRPVNCPMCDTVLWRHSPFEKIRKHLTECNPNFFKSGPKRSLTVFRRAWKFISEQGGRLHYNPRTHERAHVKPAPVPEPQEEPPPEFQANAKLKRVRDETQTEGEKESEKAAMQTSNSGVVQATVKRQRVSVQQVSQRPHVVTVPVRVPFMRIFGKVVSLDDTHLTDDSPPSEPPPKVVRPAPAYNKR